MYDVRLLTFVILIFSAFFGLCRRLRFLTGLFFWLLVFLWVPIYVAMLDAEAVPFLIKVERIHEASKDDISYFTVRKSVSSPIPLVTTTFDFVDGKTDKEDFKKWYNEQGVGDCAILITSPDWGGIKTFDASYYSCEEIYSAYIDWKENNKLPRPYVRFGNTLYYFDYY